VLISAACLDPVAQHDYHLAGLIDGTALITPTSLTVVVCLRVPTVSMSETSHAGRHVRIVEPVLIDTIQPRSSR
jgi:hypothetical protein